MRGAQGVAEPGAQVAEQEQRCRPREGLLSKDVFSGGSAESQGLIILQWA